MKVTTKALASLLIVAMLSLSTVTGAAAFERDDSPTAKQGDKKLARLIKRHDRKMELRASVIGLSADDLKEELKVKSFERIIKQHGFRSMRAYEAALMGKLKDELHRRGWSDSKIDQMLVKRLDRLQKRTA